MGGLDVVDPGYAPLLDRARAVLANDDRVSGVEVSGSIANGTADQWSDLDLQVMTVPEHYEDFLADWPNWLADITPTVFAQTPLAPFIINSVTADGLTVDIAVFSGQAGTFSPPSTYAVGMMSAQRFESIGPALEYAVAEQLRGLAGPFISLLQRNEHLRHLTGVPHLVGLLTTVFLAESGAPPPAKHWNATFDEEQRRTVAALPPLRATRIDLMAFGLGVAETVVRRARVLYPSFGLEWPSELASVVATRLRAELGVDVTDWLF